MTDKNTTAPPETPDGVSLATAPCSAFYQVGDIVCDRDRDRAEIIEVKNDWSKLRFLNGPIKGKISWQPNRNLSFAVAIYKSKEHFESTQNAKLRDGGSETDTTK